MKPDKIFLNYIEAEHENDLREIIDCKIQSKLNIDYTMLNDYFQKNIHKNFFEFGNYRKIIENVEKELNINRNRKNWISIKIVDVPPNINLKDLDATCNGDFISTKAMIKNLTEIQVGIKTAVFECRGCMKMFPMNVNDNIVVEPTICPECGGKSFRLANDLSTYRNFKLAKLEEPLELRTGGNTREFKAYMNDYLASPQHNLKVGDVVDITGDFKVVKSNKNKKDNDYEFLIDLHNITPVNDAFEDYRLTESDKKEIIRLSQEPDIYEMLVRSLAPEIVGYRTVKEGLLLQLFEGYRPRNNIFKSNVMDRWTIHILLIGDPGIGKSQLITALKNRTPRIININGADTSKAGLTTSAVKDELTGAWTLEAGALVLADTGVLCIDEFDKLRKGTQKSLNQAMEQLTVSSAKAGLVQTMSARTSIVACANPKYSRFTNYKDLKEQINIPESTLSRFDLVFKLTDNIDVEHDTELANSLLNNYDFNEMQDDVLDDELFKKYVTFAKMECFPVLSDEAKNRLVDFYVETRQSTLHNDSAKPITARDLKAIERLTIAKAKTRLSDIATIEDAEASIRIYGEALKSIGLSPETVGELQNVLSDSEITVVKDAENMIKAKMQQYNIKRVDDVLLSDVRHEINLTCKELGLSDGDRLLKVAVDNIRRG